MDQKRVLGVARNLYFTERAHRWDLQAVREIEKMHGRFLFLPLDVPLPRVNSEHFRDWYNFHAKRIVKVKADVAGPPGPSGSAGYETSPFLSIDSHPGQNPIWSDNHISSLYDEFPGLLEYYSHLPYDNPLDIRVMIWSSLRPVPPHRDAGPWLDAPVSFRCFLYDDNPESTLSIREAPATPPWPPVKNHVLPRVPETTTFAWNNVRAQHFSSHDSAHQKILLIVHPGVPNLTKLNDLLTRSATKYSQYALRSEYEQSDFF